MTDAADFTHGRRRRLLMPVLLVGAIVAGGALWKARTAGDSASVGSRSVGSDAATAPTPAERPVELAAIEVTRIVPRHLTDTVRLTGSVEPLDQTAVKSEVAERLTDVLVREGQAVTKGQVLARFDTVDLTAKLNEKLSNLEGARAQLVLAEKTLATSRTLRRKDIVVASNLDQAESNLGVQKAQVAALEAQVDVARKALRDAVVTSPIDGTVAERAVNPGETLAVNAKMFTVVDLSRVEVEATVPSDDVARLKPGQTVRLRVEGFTDRTFVGRIARINPMTRAGSRAIPVYVSLDNADGALRGGMFATGEVVVAEADNAVALPPAAIRRDRPANGEDAGSRGKPFVLVVADGMVQRREVTVVGRWAHGDLIQVDGLQEGDIVVTAPLPGLTAGRPATVATGS